MSKPTDHIVLRILHLVDYLIFTKAISNQSEFCDKIKLPRQTLSNIKGGRQFFTVNHIDRICKVYGVNANWIFGSETKVFNGSESLTITDVPGIALPAMRKTVEN